MRVPGTAKEIHPVELLEWGGIANPLEQLPLGDKVDVLVVGKKVVDDSQKSLPVVFVVEPGGVVVEAKGSSVARV